ncbi:MAG: pyrroloquinoline quinone-dependent dehydrogenase [Acidimicrobiia bacterium]|nr:pyrroloquinoline quinone-dependent dehydrogenase [Acidimicrobiia bacterium]
MSQCAGANARGARLNQWVMGVAVAASFLARAVAQVPPASPPPAGEWRHYAGDAAGTKYSPLSQISKDNLQSLTVAWRWPSPDNLIHASDPGLRPGRFEDTPLMVKGTLYTVTSLGIVAALDPASGRTKWTYDPRSYDAGRPTNPGFVVRGVAYWSDGSTERILHATSDAYLLSIDARTGVLDSAFGTNGRVDIAAGLPGVVRARNFAGRPPFVAGDVIVVGNTVADLVLTKENPPGHVRAYDARTGHRLWEFRTVPKEGEFGSDTWLEGSAAYTGNTNVWTGMAYDPELDFLYFPTSTPTNDYYGGQRPGDNLFAESLVCVKARTGERVWHYQVVHHGLWDYDLPATPILGDVTVDGRRIKAVMQVSKQAFTYVFDRETGTPVWPIVERPVPQSSVPRERTSPTQPIPTKPPPFDLQGAIEDNLIDFTPALRTQALNQLRLFEHGPLYTPPSLKGTLALPGIQGGGNWGGAGFDPESGILYVPSRMSPSVMRLRAVEPDRGTALYAQAGSTAELTAAMTIEGLSIFKPPYSRVTAIDMHRGTHVWMSPVGNGPLRHPLLRNLSLAPLGDAIQGGSVLITKTLLFVGVSRLGIGGSPAPPLWAEWGDPDAERKVIYVFHKASGELLRVIELENASVAGPMTYLHNGKQYIVVAAGGGAEAEVVAFSLPSGIS